MDATAFMNGILDRDCPADVDKDSGVYRFTIQLCCQTIEVTAKKLADGHWNKEEDVWTSGGWEIISFTSR